MCTLESHLINNKPSGMKAEKDVKRKRSKKEDVVLKKKTETKDEKLLELKCYITGEEEEKEAKDDEYHGESENEIDEHDVDLGGDDEEESEDDDEEESEDGPSQETETDEDIQSGKSKEEKKIESEQHVGQDNQVSPTLERMMSKSINGDDVGDDYVTTKAPIFDETPHTSKPAEDKRSQSDFTTSMMIEYEIKEAKMLMKVEESAQLDFSASMIVEYEQKENQILIDRQKEQDKIKNISNDDPSFDLHISQLTPDGYKKLVGTQSVENVSKVITESEFLNTKEEEKPQGALQSQEPKEDGKKEKPSRYKRKCDMPRFVMETLRPRQYLHINVIQAWAHILNHEEKFKSKDSIARLFSTQLMLDVDDVDLGEDDVDLGEDDVEEPDHYVYEVKRHT
ncbi:hypothetical protein L1987_14743 [Smallanthus sonchifolius]|uniref:Uncharacterized protein n=1 Tax=Smallanthus sonchifolius TaxID=185202 RepID=A0ACB9J4H2_9ASTR|nr:hypothetical protein L1987_14743 [Smallanthus sonchifolius]